MQTANTPMDVGSRRGEERSEEKGREEKRKRRVEAAGGEQAAM